MEASIKNTMVLASLCGLLIVARIGQLHLSYKKSNTPPPLAGDTELESKEAEPRLIYPNSVVPGGVHSIQDVVHATNDPVVKAHYAGVDFKNLKRVVLTGDLYAYVSYRIGARIYWTKKKQRITAGEVVFTDGIHVIRGRCGNCILAKTPEGPVSPEEPPEKVLNVPLIPAPLPPLLVSSEPTPGPGPYRSTVTGPVPGPSLTSTRNPSPWWFPPIFFPFLPPSNPPAPQPPPTGVPPVVTGPPPVVPPV